MKSILLHNNQLDERGTTNSVYQYALGCRDILGLEVHIAAPENSNLISLPKFQQQFGDNIKLYTSISDLQAYRDAHDIEVCYWQKSGENDRNELLNARNVVHCVFTGTQPHGDRYSAISKWLGERDNIPYVPYIVTLPDCTEDYRERLEIPENALVVGRFGGYDSFDIPYVHQVIEQIVKNREDIYFLFLNTKPSLYEHPRILYFEATTDELEKAYFINTLDVSLHARSRGETFGLAVAESLYQNKPVITCIDAPERNHIQMMGNKGFYYQTPMELYAILMNFKRPEFDYSTLVKGYSPENVMKQFNEIFLK